MSMCMRVLHMPSGTPQGCNCEVFGRGCHCFCTGAVPVPLLSPMESDRSRCRVAYTHCTRDCRDTAGIPVQGCMQHTLRFASNTKLVGKRAPKYRTSQCSIQVSPAERAEIPRVERDAAGLPPCHIASTALLTSPVCIWSVDQLRR